MDKQIAVQPQYAVQDVERMGAAIAKSGLFGIKTPEQAIALMLIAQAQGRHPATVAMEYDIIQGRPALKSQAALMRFQESGGKIRYITRTDAVVEAEFSHPSGGTLTVHWDMARAAKMGLSTKDNWIKQPMIMLQWRVVAEGVRACYPACLGGSYLVEEVQDFEPRPEPRNVTPPATVVVTPVAEVVPAQIEHTPDPSPAQPAPAAPASPITPHPADASTFISDAQGKRFYAIAKKSGATDADLKIWMMVNYGIDSTRKITKSLYEEMCTRVKTEINDANEIPFGGPNE